MPAEVSSVPAPALLCPPLCSVSCLRAWEYENYSGVPVLQSSLYGRPV